MISSCVPSVISVRCKAEQAGSVQVQREQENFVHNIRNTTDTTNITDTTDTTNRYNIHGTPGIDFIGRVKYSFSNKLFSILIKH